ncbi:SET and MYND domain-containing protein 4-like [Diachasmimorpha longicaudata]|uniref:SET and MYND domain-containing protein 4-like n=1 Tax=Diachasmimorpha longicaudata TaxID=58733 RepID=UPI0030B87305
MCSTSKDVGDHMNWYQYLENFKRLDTWTKENQMCEFDEAQNFLHRVEFHVTKLRALNIIVNLRPKRVKSESVSQQYVAMGDKVLTTNPPNFPAALKYYSLAIMFLTPGTLEMARMLEKRSIIAFKNGNYENCLRDIARALEHDNPEELIAQSHARTARSVLSLNKGGYRVRSAVDIIKDLLANRTCKGVGDDLTGLLATEENASNSDPPVHYDPRRRKVKPIVDGAPCSIVGATGVGIGFAGNCGRYILALRKFQPGEIIAVTPSYASSHSFGSSYKACAECTTPTTAGIPCHFCPYVLYCSESCRSNAWKVYHQMECSILGLLLDADVPTTAVLAMKILLKALKETGSVDDLEALVERLDVVTDPLVHGFTEDVFDCSKYAAVHSLLIHPDKHMGCDRFHTSLVSLMIIYYLATMTEAFGPKYPKYISIVLKEPNLRFLVQLLMKLWQIVEMNAKRPNQFNMTNHDDVILTPFTSLLNHSCNPNVLIFGNYEPVVIALRPIKAGEPIFCSYQDHTYNRILKNLRRPMLLERYFFHCYCVACTDDWPCYRDLPHVSEWPRMTLRLMNGIRLTKKFCSRERILHDGNPKITYFIEKLCEHPVPCKELIEFLDRLKHDCLCRYQFR